MLNNKKGFTLIELLVVIGIIAVLAGAVIVALNPARQFAQARNSQRQAHVTSILNAIGQRIAENRGTFDGTFTVGGVNYTCPALPAAPAQTITDDVPAVGTEIDLDCLVPTFLSTMPVDPQTGVWTDRDNYDTQYTVVAEADGRITVAAPDAEIGDVISETR